MDASIMSIPTMKNREDKEWSLLWKTGTGLHSAHGVSYEQAILYRDTRLLSHAEWTAVVRNQH
jgi:hypothetical protein